MDLIYFSCQRNKGNKKCAIKQNFMIDLYNRKSIESMISGDMVNIILLQQKTEYIDYGNH